MIILYEFLVVAAIFTAIILITFKINPKSWVYDFPPEVVKLCIKNGYVEEKETKIRLPKKVIIKKAIASLVFAIVFALVVFFINGKKTFLEGFLTSYILWLSVCWYDALILDSICACNMKFFRFPGTENEDKAYRNYWFHIKMSLIGSVLGLFICLLAGLFVFLFALI